MRGHGVVMERSESANAEACVLKLTFLGTAASEGYPNAFCSCDNCGRARELGGNSLRMRSAALVDDDLLIDFGPDLMAASLTHGISLGTVKYCLLTHEHADHLDASNLYSRSPRCAVVGAPRLELLASSGALRWAIGQHAHEYPELGLLDSDVQDRLNLSARVIAAGETVCVGPYRVTAIPAAHDSGRITPHLYAIERDGRSLFYATDTGPLGDNTWAVLRAWGGRFDVVALDHTFGTAGRSTGHLNADQFVETIDRLRGEHLLDPSCRVFAHHLGHHSNPDHDVLTAYARLRGYEVAYDGLTVLV
jgi:phosphoribosyl 1,2-cyclic phosphate phosphodiesterase